MHRSYCPFSTGRDKQPRLLRSITQQHRAHRHATHLLHKTSRSALQAGLGTPASRRDERSREPCCWCDLRGAEGRKANGRRRGDFTPGNRARVAGTLHEVARKRAPSFLLRGAVCPFCGEERAGCAARVCGRLCNELPSQVGGTGPVRPRPGEGNGCGSCHRFRGRCGDVRSDRNQDWHSPSTWLPLILLLRLVSMTVALPLCGGV